MLKAGNLARQEDRRVRGGQNWEIPTKLSFRSYRMSKVKHTVYQVTPNADMFYQRGYKQ